VSLSEELLLEELLLLEEELEPLVEGEPAAAAASC